MKSKLLNISLKMIIVGIVALFLAKFLGVTNYTTASAIGILSVQWTKRDFFSIAYKRIISGVLSIIVSALLFYFLGQSFLMFSLFMVVFIICSWFFNAPEGIVPSMVIVAHIFLVDKITLSFVFEEILLLVIAIVIAFIVNMLYPQYTVNEMKESLFKVDKIIEDELQLIINNLNEKNINIISNANSEIKSIMGQAKMIDRDLILQNDHRYITYLYMRNTQLKILNTINRNIQIIKGNHPYKEKIANFLELIMANIGFNDRATPLLDDLDELYNFFINEKLPVTRQEFEIRAILFQMLNEIRSFLTLKIDFHQKYPHFMEEGNEKNES